MVVLTFCIDKQMPENKYFEQTFLSFKRHLTAGIPFGGKPLSLLHRFLQWPSLDGKTETFHDLLRRNISDSIIEKDK